MNRGADAEVSGRFLACSEAPGWKRQGRRLVVEGPAITAQRGRAEGWSVF